MSATLGTGAVVGAALLAVFAAVAWWWSAHGSGPFRPKVRRAAVLASLLTSGLVAVAVLVMIVALVSYDDDFDYVVMVAEPAMPLYYRVSALWSAMEGSLLLWLLAVATVSAAFVVTTARRADPGHGGAAGILALFVAAFALVVIVADPFVAGGGEMGPPPSPLLQDHPAMGVHPPLLYAGFAGLAVPFALSCAALHQRAVSGPWARSLHRWTIAAWIPLTAGIVLGAWWSYAVLGWGGYWAWDPVENASLMPWLIATALLHASGPRARGAGWRRWAVVLAGLGFVFVLLATFLTRSGVVESIHAFSVSPLGPLLLGIMAVALLGWLALLLRPGALPRGDEPAPVVSRQTALQINRVLLTAITVIVLVGSLLPTLLMAINGDRISVGPPWYARTLGPVAGMLLGAMAVAPWLSWSGGEPRDLVRRITPALLLAAVAVGVVGVVVADVWLAIVVGLAVLVLASPIGDLAGRARRERQRLGAYLAHAGIAVGAVAVVAGGHADVSERTIPIGGTVSAGETSATLVGLDRRQEGNRSIAEARILLADGDTVIGEETPQLRWYERHATVLAGPGIRTEPWRDVYVTLLDVDAAEGGATIRLAVTPLASWLWLSAGLVVAGAAVSAFSRRPVITRSAERDQQPRSSPV
ncbi:hypothetical protein D9V41_07575 [Aeromicrobium phragmitis]|uniref:Heme lyase CcmF/NrfE family subunit n=1 Tax=Aeromicrobium phragmitis TaxID=2478914 RepID=A0A3L8PNB4_9ACTN|nr:cytochrome c-type biogenesis CcmF C-terminal domain-containing protein [Aeromicrobium phragmitis]RLV56279.1 hypothetical protein D9V41_07575 [Aeromicrobium phragmitis]